MSRCSRRPLPFRTSRLHRPSPTPRAAPCRCSRPAPRAALLQPSCTAPPPPSCAGRAILDHAPELSVVTAAAALAGLEADLMLFLLFAVVK